MAGACNHVYGCTAAPHGIRGQGLGCAVNTKLQLPRLHRQAALLPSNTAAAVRTCCRCTCRRQGSPELCPAPQKRTADWRRLLLHTWQGASVPSSSGTNSRQLASGTRLTPATLATAARYHCYSPLHHARQPHLEVDVLHRAAQRGIVVCRQAQCGMATRSTV